MCGCTCLCRGFVLNGRAKDEIRHRLHCSLAERVTCFRAVDAVETDTFRVLAVQDCDGVAIKDGDDSSGVVGSEARLYDERDGS